MRLTWAAALLVAVTLVLAGCGGNEGLRAGATPEPAPISGRALADFELFVQGSEEGNIFFADVFGIELAPLAAHRLTSGKRISTMDANAEHIVVAAADGDVDRLGYVQPDGQIGEIPGLGRPYAYTPRFDRDGSILYSDLVERADGSDLNLFFDWDPRTGKRRTLLKTPSDDVYGPAAGPEGKVAFLGSPGKPRVVVIRDADNRAHTLPVRAQVNELLWGSKLIALEVIVDGADAQIGFRPTGTVLLDPRTGKQTRVDGWHPLAWTPDGKRLLVRRTTDRTGSTLALLDPANRDQIQELGTLSQLTIYSAAWVKRAG